jgi:cytidylate kinase
MVITIDGPTASGKGSVAKAIAAQFNMDYMDTGALYRAMGLIAARELGRANVAAGKGWEDYTVFHWARRIAYRYRNGGAQISIDGVDVTNQLRTPESDWYASHVSSVTLVRKMLLRLQRSLAEKQDLVIDGRDCGTVVFPKAQFKFFLTASLDVRVARAHADTARKAQDMSIEDVRDAVLQRDMRDLLRTYSPLVPARDAVILDSTHLSQEAVEALVVGYLRLR